MNQIPFDAEAVEATAKATINNANQVVDIALSRSVDILERNVRAAKETIERQSDYAESIRNARSVEDIAKIQEKIGKRESKAIEEFSQEIYRLSSEAATDLASLSDNNKRVAEDLVADTLGQIADSIPNGGTQPYGSFFREMVRNQAEAYRTFNTLVGKAVETQRENFNSVAEAVTQASKQVAKGAKQNSKRGK